MPGVCIVVIALKAISVRNPASGVIMVDEPALVSEVWGELDDGCGHGLYSTVSVCNGAKIVFRHKNV